MKRRNFLKLAGAASLAVATPWFGGSVARANDFQKYDGPLWISVNAMGGWDPTMLCDPKGGSVNQGFSTAEIAQVGAFSVAPYDNVVAFFNKHKDHAVVFNGVDTSTNSHEPGRRNIWSGQLGEGYPTFAALVAACRAPEVPMAFISNGGYDFTASLVAPTRAENGDLDIIKRIANPNAVDTGATKHYHDADMRDLIHTARDTRLAALRKNQRLPRIEHAMGTLYTARMGQGGLKSLTEHLDAMNPDEGSTLKGQASLAIAAYKAGLCVSANLTTGGFDTHDNHDTKQGAAMATLIEGVDYIMDEAAAQGIADKVVVVVSSDFARTPNYNGGNGKDHWPYTSMFAVGAGITPKVVGATDPMQGAMRIKPMTGEVVGDDDKSAKRLSPAMIHKQLRKLAQIDDHELAKAYPIDAPDLPIFDL